MVADAHHRAPGARLVSPRMGAQHDAATRLFHPLAHSWSSRSGSASGFWAGKVFGQAPISAAAIFSSMAAIRMQRMAFTIHVARRGANARQGLQGLEQTFAGIDTAEGAHNQGNAP